MGEVTELRLPAAREYILVAKRTAAAAGAVAGFDMEAIDDLSIAVAQAVDNAISCLERAGALSGQVRLSFKLGERGLEVMVRSTVSREAEAEAREERARAELARAERQRQARLREQQEVMLGDLALRLMGLFVDQSTYRLDERTGGLHVRLTKYRVS
jgi:anti-sigma regulatory factor (Ser/Thr protein kinase)